MFAGHLVLSLSGLFTPATDPHHHDEEDHADHLLRHTDHQQDLLGQGLDTQRTPRPSPSRAAQLVESWQAARKMMMMIVIMTKKMINNMITLEGGH